jgi:hypothetical protein
LAVFQAVYCAKNYTRVQIVQCETKHTVDTALSHACQLPVFVWMISTGGNSKEQTLQNYRCFGRLEVKTFYDVHVTVHRDKFL